MWRRCVCGHNPLNLPVMMMSCSMLTDPATDANTKTVRPPYVPSDSAISKAPAPCHVHAQHVHLPHQPACLGNSAPLHRKPVIYACT